MNIETPIYNTAIRLDNDTGVKCELCRRDKAEAFYRKKKLCLDCKITLVDQDYDSFYERGE